MQVMRARRSVIFTHAAAAAFVSDTPGVGRISSRKQDQSDAVSVASDSTAFNTRRSTVAGLVEDVLKPRR